MILRTCVLALSIAALLLPDTSFARLTRLVIAQTTPLAGGVSWGNTGSYERLVGTAFFEVDPRDPLNAVIVDLDKAPRNARGIVEFRTTVLHPEAGRHDPRQRQDLSTRRTIAATTRCSHAHDRGAGRRERLRAAPGLHDRRRRLARRSRAVADAARRRSSRSRGSRTAARSSG